jgi:hypothetical protein
LFKLWQYDTSETFLTMNEKMNNYWPHIDIWIIFSSINYLTFQLIYERKNLKASARIVTSSSLCSEFMILKVLILKLSKKNWSNTYTALMDSDDANWSSACCQLHAGFLLDILLSPEYRVLYIITWLRVIKKLTISVRFTILQYSKEIVLDSLLHPY